MSADFYQSLAVFENFTEVSEGKHYTPVPEDWWVVITDVAGSTQAISEGRYKQVNLVGASTIIAVVNALKGKSVPYVFGGDGATILVHEADVEAIRPVLLASKKMAKQAFGMEMRVGAVPAAKVIQAGRQIEVAKYRLSGTAALAMFRGGGLNLAEKLIKSDESYAFKPSENAQEPPADLSGLSCRWSPIKAKRDEMLSILIMAFGEPDQLAEIYRQVLLNIEHILGEGEESHPVTLAGISKRGISFKGFADEIRMQCQGRGWWERVKIISYAVFTFLIMNVFLRFKIPSPVVDSEKYAKELAEGADFRKFDDMLRMVRDCTISQRQRISEYLERLRAEGKLVYGLYSSSHALMTCYVASLTDHVHFIDGSDGGYAMAAKQLKQQVRELAKS